VAMDIGTSFNRDSAVAIHGYIDHVPRTHMHINDEHVATGDFVFDELRYLFFCDNF
jgi:hypothetical protein